ncbi:hypothetical protein TRAPUB_474 [Trametes pubescens]|uniref:BTB domain-containing protein n=1 Tax=Trametes pubescens TaxID=154538 RepID=A0A1M2VM01_TRAPU|nr:hypothetical protein TRAPUB_474 [Trametes pubescens]
MAIAAANPHADANINRIYAPLPPYNDPAAGDAIIRTSDGTELHVRKSHLAIVGLDPNGIVTDMRPTHGSPKPAVVVQETAAIWEKVLRICLMHEEQPYTLDDIAALLEVGRKYDIAGMPSRLRYALVQPAFLEKEPVRVFLVACAYGLHDMAEIAARRTLEIATLRHNPFDALHAASAADYHRLLAYREECGRAASAVTQPRVGEEVLPEWISGKPAHWKPLSMTCVGGCAVKSKTLLVVEGEGKPTTIYVRIRESWITYLETLGAMLAEQPQASLASSPELIEPVISSAVECAHCAKTIYPYCVAFSRAMEVEIGKAVAKVSDTF